IGAFTVFAGLSAPQGRVLAVEPEETNFRMLQRNVALNELQNVETWRFAVGGGFGSATILAHGSESRIVDASESDQTVDVVPLAELTSSFDRIDLLKMDCEGAEFDALFSAPPAELQKIRRIVMEYHDQSDQKNAKALTAWLE